MKRFFILALCLMLFALSASAETVVTPVPPEDTKAAKSASDSLSGNITLDDVLTAWENLTANSAAYTTLKSNDQMISTEALFRVLATYCMQINTDTTWAMMADYEPEITVENDQIEILTMTHALGFTLTLNAYTGECVSLRVDDSIGNG